MTSHSNLHGGGEEGSQPEITITGMAAMADLPEEDHDLVGEQFGKYLIVGEVAVGGMAEVFLGVQRGLEGFTKVVVIKRVLPHFSSNPEFVRMFIDEARLAARLEHPNIVRTYEFGELDGQYFTVMEYLPGEDLGKTLQKLVFAKQMLPLHVAVGIVSSICSGLQFAHQLTDTAGRPLNLVHRDINPANIIVTYTGEVKIIDFGVAKTNANQTHSGTIKGKVAYMSPEHLLGRGVDQRSDVFSVGVVLWELLTRQPLFMRETEAATLYAIMNDPIAPPSRYRSDVPRVLDEITMRALARTPVDRYDSADEMRDALERFLAGQPKFDSRVLGRLVEDLFGARRAEAKRSIAQSRSLNRNVSLVMKLRTDVTGHAIRLDALAEGSGTGGAAEHVDAAGGSRGLAILLALVLVLAGAAGAYFLVFRKGAGGAGQLAATPTAQATLRVTSTPPGAAIAIDGEPTGLKTPASITGISANQVELRLELPHHRTLAETIKLPAEGTLEKEFTLVRARGRLAIAELPQGAVVLVAGGEHLAGEVIDLPAGPHDVRIEFEGNTIAEQRLEIGSGLQKYQLTGEALVPVTPGTPGAP